MGILGTYLSASQAMRVGKAWLRTVLRLPDQSSLPLPSEKANEFPIVQMDGEFGNLGDGFGRGGFNVGSNGHQNTNGYGDTSYVSRHNGGGLPQLNGQGHTQALSYPIQTSWPYGNNSSDTSVNQTSAGNSAGVDPSNGISGQGNFDVGPNPGPNPPDAPLCRR